MAYQQKYLRRVRKNTEYVYGNIHTRNGGNNAFRVALAVFEITTFKSARCASLPAYGPLPNCLP